MSHSSSLHRKIWQIAWPMILANLSVPLLGLVDTALLGHLEESHYLGAVAVGSTILAFLYWGFGFLRMGTTGATAHAWGEQDSAQLQLVLWQSIILALAIALLVWLCHPLLFQIGLWWVAPEGATTLLAREYLEIRILSAPAVLINYTLIGWMIGRQNTRIPLLMVLLSNTLNILLDSWFILGLDLNSRGAAWGTVISEYAAMLLGLIVCLRSMERRTLPLQQLKVLGRYLTLLSTNRHLFIRTLALLSGMAFFTAQSGAQGAEVLAANTILLNLVMLISYGLDGFAHAAEALCGEACGQRDRTYLDQIIRATGYCSLVTAALFTLAFLLFGHTALNLFTDQPELLATARDYLPWLIAMPLLAVGSYLMDGIYIGINASRTMQNAMLFSLLVIYLPLWWLALPLGNHGLWLAFAAFNVSRGVSLMVRLPSQLRQGNWQ